MKVRKLLSQAGEALTNGHGGAEVENFDIDVNGQVALSKELCCANSSFLQNILLFSANCCGVFCKLVCCETSCVEQNPFTHFKRLWREESLWRTTRFR